jgi:hypothetical protein
MCLGSRGSSWLDLGCEVGVATTGVATLRVLSTTPCRLASQSSPTLCIKSFGVRTPGVSIPASCVVAFVGSCTIDGVWVGVAAVSWVCKGHVPLNIIRRISPKPKSSLRFEPRHLWSCELSSCNLLAKTNHIGLCAVILSCLFPGNQSHGFFGVVTFVSIICSSMERTLVFDSVVSCLVCEPQLNALTGIRIQATFTGVLTLLFSLPGLKE